MCVFKFPCTCATTPSIPNLLLSRSSFLNSAVSSWMLPDFAHIHKNFDRVSKLISCSVITLSPFPSKIFSKTADTSQTCINTKSQPFLVKYGCQITLVQLVECPVSKARVRFGCLGLSGGFVFSILTLNSVRALIFHALDNSR